MTRRRKEGMVGEEREEKKDKERKGGRRPKGQTEKQKATGRET